MFMSCKFKSILFLVFLILTIQVTAKLESSSKIPASKTSMVSPSSASKGGGIHTKDSSRGGSGTSSSSVQNSPNAKNSPPKPKQRNGPGTFGSLQEAGYA
ncbi:hypothetical protein VKT23_020146 [Stygiomarasmius scandens]|uniref:Uncharacterized protein n=1 Tax=Marasmiellus scandens TaxID=2682957 RepID=A0ABR1INJ3_9AGAR